MTAAAGPSLPTSSRFLFGVNVPTSAAAGADPIGIAQRAEALGFDFVSINDHLHGEQPSFETWTLLTWLAAHTQRIGVVTRVLGVPYRSPAVLAKMAESLDRLTEGRLTLGLGGGSSDDEFRAFGLGEHSPRQKVDGMQDAIEILHGLWTTDHFTYSGRRYETKAAQLSPKPSRRIPIWLGTYGPRALGITGRLADGWIPSHGYAPMEPLRAMHARVLRAAEGAGRDPHDIACIYNLEIRVDALAKPSADIVCGSVDSVIDQLLGFVAIGFAGFNVIPAGPGPDEQTEIIATAVMPGVRAAL